MTTTTTTFSTGHVGLNVVDLDRSKHFYASVFGFELTTEGTDERRRFAFLASGGKLAVTLWQQADSAFQNTHAGLHHVAFQVDTVAEVGAAEARLRALGADFAHDGIVAHAEGSQSGGIFFSDPDGIRLEIYSPNAGHGHDAPAGTAPTCGFF